MDFTKNPYVTYHDEKSKKFIQLNKDTIIDFKSSEQFDLTPSNANAFAECMYRTSKLYACYSYLRQFPTTVNIAPDGMVTLDSHAKFIDSWNRIGLDTLLNNANMTWGDKLFTDVTPHEIQDMTNTRGEVTGRVRITLNYTGKGILFQTLDKHNDGSPCSIILDK